MIWEYIGTAFGPFLLGSHGHGSWLMCEVTLGPFTHKIEGT
jgi:hypothetical protein